MSVHDPSVTDLGVLVGHALEEQVELQLEVTKAELARDARSVARSLAPLGLLLGAAAVGSVFLLVGCALALAPWVGAALSAVIVGGSVLGAALIGSIAALSRPEVRWLLPVRRAGGYRVR